VLLDAAVAEGDAELDSVPSRARLVLALMTGAATCSASSESGVAVRDKGSDVA